MAPRKIKRGARQKDDEPEIIMPEEISAPVKETVKPYVITLDQYDDLWEAYHGGYSAGVDVDRKALVAAFSDYGSQPGDLVLEEGRRNSKYVTCDRETLGFFLRNLREMYEKWDQDLRKAGIPIPK